MLKRALAIQETALGAEHPAALRASHNLTTLYRETGAYGKAEALLLRIIGAQRSAGSSAGGDLSLSLVTLGIVYSETGRHVQAVRLCKEALNVAAEKFGAEHPYTFVMANGLGTAYRRSGDYANAESILKRAIAISKNLPEARETAAALSNLADLYADGGAYAEAEPLYRRAIAIFEQSFGAETPRSLDALKSLAVLHWAKGQLGNAARTQ